MARILVVAAAVHLCTAIPWQENLPALLEIHPKSTLYWQTLGAKGGGTVSGKHYTRKDCFQKALEGDLRIVGTTMIAKVWTISGSMGGVTVKGKHYTPKECEQKALELDPKLAEAWYYLGNHGGGTVNYRSYTPKECYQKALELDPRFTEAWYYLGVHGGDTVKDKSYTPKECYQKALEVNPRFTEAWYNLGNHGGGTVKYKSYTLKECYQKALELDPKLAEAWVNLGVHGGGTVKDKSYTLKECFQTALELDGEHGWYKHETKASAWYNLGVHGGGTVGSQTYSRTQCFEKAQELYRQVLNNSLARLPKTVDTKEDFAAVAEELLEGDLKEEFRTKMTVIFLLCKVHSPSCTAKATAELAMWRTDLARKLPSVPAEVAGAVLDGVLSVLTCDSTTVKEGLSQELIKKAACHARNSWKLHHPRRLTWRDESKAWGGLLAGWFWVCLVERPAASSPTLATPPQSGFGRCGRRLQDEVSLDSLAEQSHKVPQEPRSCPGPCLRPWPWHC